MSKRSLYLYGALLIIGIISFTFIKKYSSPKLDSNTNQIKVEAESEDIKTTKEYIGEAFGKKYLKPIENFKIEVLKEEGNFAKGSVNFNNEHSGALWFAVKQSGGWELVYDGNGIIPCDVANGHNLPTDMVPACIDTNNGNIFVQR